MRWLTLALLAAAMQPAAQLQTASESIDVTVIEVDVVVVDASGKPVRGLTKDDFELTVGGKRRPITNFYSVERSASSAGHAGSPNAVAPAVRRNYLVLFVDDLHLRQRDKSRMLGSLRRFVSENVHVGTAIMVVSSNGDAQVKQPFTEDADAVLGVIDAIWRQPAHADEYESERRELLKRIDTEGPITILIYRQQMQTLADRERRMTKQTIDALDQVVRSTAGLDGRRVVVYVSSGLPMQPAAEIFDHYKPDLHIGSGTSAIANRAIADETALDAMHYDLSASFQQLAAGIAEKGVQFFAIDAAGMRGFDQSNPREARDPGLNSTLIRSNLDSPLQLLADETGGRAIVDRNNLDAAFSELADHLSTYYSLGFRSDGSKQTQAVQVRVRRPGLTVKATKSIRERDYREQIEAGVRSRLYARDENNPLHAELSMKDVSSSSQVSVAIRVPADSLSLLPNGEGEAAAFDVYVAMLDDSMRESPLRVIRHKLRSQESATAVQHIVLRAKPGRYTVSVAVVDAFSWQTSYFQRTVELH